jgi:hypothetical protein
MKDFYDLLTLSHLFEFEGKFVSAIRATVDRRGTAVPTATPEGLGDRFAENNEKQRQWTAFVRREPLLIAAPDLRTVINEIGRFTLSPIKAEATHAEFNFRWRDGGPWVGLPLIVTPGLKLDTCAT